MLSAEIRRRFLAHFRELGHTVVPSASLIADDPTLMLVNAGMVPFKPYFLGELPAPYPRAASVQKCVRTGDLDEVGKTTRHASFFEMCGNFSFGDYFKEGAIPYAWELLTKSIADGGFGLAEGKLWVTVYTDDDEAERLWRDSVGISPRRIQRRGKADNFWSMTVPGPCGPCSEIYFDRGPEHGIDGGPVADETRYLEVWNLVFMQYERGPTGPSGDKEDYPILGELPAKNIDTGMGLDRMATLLQGVENLYEIDTTRQVLDRAAELTGTTYGKDPRSDVSLRVIADHVRTATMLIGDGVTPGNEGRGYVLRKLLRRAVWSNVVLGAREPVLGEQVEAAIAAMGASYPDLLADAGRIRGYAVAEEESFRSTLQAGTTLLESAVEATRARGGRIVAGGDAFKLHDTYGFPIDLTIEMAAEQGLSVDEEGFRRLMAEQRSRAKSDRLGKGIGHLDVSAYREALDSAGPTQFSGFTESSRESIVRALIGSNGPVSVASEGDELELVLDVTPFYAEGGGQQPDLGRLVMRGSGTDAELEVLDVQRPIPDLVVHRVKVSRGELHLGAAVQATIDVERRRAISRAHTATHLVHRAFRGALGEAATQAGSLNAPGRLRFDFSSPSAVPVGVLADVEDEVNDVLLHDHEVRAFITTQEEARRIGAMALFGEKYGDEVRVVEVGDYARELCGGTHVARSGQLGLIKLLHESSIGSGVRRVEALVGLDAFRFLAREHVIVAGLSDALKARPEELSERVDGLLSRLRGAERELEHLKGAAVLGSAATVAGLLRSVNGIQVVTHIAPNGIVIDDVRRLALDVRGRLDPAKPGVVVVFSVTDGRPAVVVAVNDTGRQAGLGAGRVVREVAPHLGGGGGGKDDVAQGGGTKPEGVPAAVAAVDAVVADMLAGNS